MAKCKHKIRETHSVGGIYFTSKAFTPSHLEKSSTRQLELAAWLILATSGTRLVSALFDIYLCCADCVEDVNRSECHLRESPNAHTPTSRTVGRAIKKLACENIEYK